MSRLFGQELRVINMGLESFAWNLERESVPVLQVDWKPPLIDDPRLIDLMQRADIAEANAEVVRRVQQGRPILQGVSTAGEAIPGMDKHLILHAGPPIEWKRMCGPMRGAILGGLMLEKLAATPQEAEALITGGEVKFAPCHHHAAVGPMAGVITWSMPVWVVENTAFGNRAYASFNEGLGKVLRYGSFSPEVIERLRWMTSELAPLLQAALERHGLLDLRNLIAQALQMGDECHNRNKAATSLFLRELAPDLAVLPAEREQIARALAFMAGNDHWFLNLSMAASKSVLDAAANVEGSSALVTMARNGTDFGIRLSGCGKAWFVAPANFVEGLYFPGYSAADAAPDLGDSAITETAGLGGFAMAAAPAITLFVGGSPAQAQQYSQKMYEITLAESEVYRIPSLDFRGSPLLIDLLKVCKTGIRPIINTGIAHKEAGVGQIGAGLVHPPDGCFQNAWKAFVQRTGPLGPKPQP
jgi:hypothetical protein